MYVVNSVNVVDIAVALGHEEGILSSFPYQAQGPHQPNGMHAYNIAAAVRLRFPPTPSLQKIILASPGDALSCCSVCTSLYSLKLQARLDVPVLQSKCMK